MGMDMGEKTVTYYIPAVGKKKAISNHSVSIISNVRNTCTYKPLLEGKPVFF